jgi:hypothetical protein
MRNVTGAWRRLRWRGRLRCRPSSCKTLDVEKLKVQLAALRLARFGRSSEKPNRQTDLQKGGFRNTMVPTPMTEMVKGFRTSAIHLEAYLCS